MVTVPFRYSASIQLDNTGAGQVKLGPQSARERWHDMTVAVSANQNPTNEAQCQVFAGDVNTKSFRDSCVDGSTGDSTGKVTDTIGVGEFVYAIWSGGDPRVYATMTITGMKDV